MVMPHSAAISLTASLNAFSSTNHIASSFPITRKESTTGTCGISFPLTFKIHAISSSVRLPCFFAAIFANSFASFVLTTLASKPMHCPSCSFSPKYCITVGTPSCPIFIRPKPDPSIWDAA